MTHLQPSVSVQFDEKALEAAYAAVDQLPLRDFEHIGGDLDKLRGHEGARAAVTAYLSAIIPSHAGSEGVFEPFGETALAVADENQSAYREWLANRVPSPTIPQDVQASNGDVREHRKLDLGLIEATVRKVNPGRSEDHIKSVALDCLSVIRALSEGSDK